LSALERRVESGQPIDRPASVASFFVSRVDTKVDAALDALTGPANARGARARGHIAIANAKLAYEVYQGVFQGPRWEALAAKGARPQRVLWASTSPKDPRYTDLHYADALIGKDTIDTMTKATIAAFLDHGRPEPTLALGRDEARAHLAALGSLGLDLGHMTAELERDGVRAFADSYDEALRAINKKRALPRSA
jgi:transaldolase